MKVKVEATVKKWIAPREIQTEEGLKVPLEVADLEVIDELCKDWLRDIAITANLQFGEFVLNFKRK